jgi:uncharacterized membrane protein YjdF
MGSQLIHRRVTFVLQAVLVVGVIAEILAKQWFAAVITSGIILVTFVPLFLQRQFRVFIPPEFALFSIVFVFASLFLGEVHGYYARYWWWDIALHAASGFLLGIVGFLLVYVLNEAEAVDLHLRPGFVALFSFLFSLGIGTLWEIFEFGMDSFFGTNMQKPMLGDPSGLTDTMWDLIVDALGALVIAVLGYGYIRAAKNESFLERWIQDFIRTNPRFFDRIPR